MDSILISVRVQPNAARSEVVGFTGDLLAVRVAALPVQGKANRALVELLSKVLCISRGKIEVVRGQTARNKVIAVTGLSREAIMERLRPV